VKVPVHPGPGSLRKGDRIVLPTGALTDPVTSVESGVDRQGPFTRIRIGPEAEQTWRTDATVEVARDQEIP
jgi:hypothetical protein